MAAAQAKRGKDPDPRVVFLRNFFKRPKEVGSVIPSSRFLERRIVRCADLADARMVVELGPGTGGTTRALLHAMRPDAKLLAIEINPQLVRLIRSSIRDPRLVVQAGDAGDLARILATHGLPAPDVVLSGIPFSTMPVDVGRRILEAVNAALAPGGRFVAYQLRDRVEILGKRVFGTARKQMELRNLPPMRVYRFEKTPAPLAP